MAAEPVTVAIPVLNGGRRLEEVLAAVARQRLDRPIELLVADSESHDGSVSAARGHGAEVIEVAREDFSHGGTRNRLAERASGTHIAFLTQDAVPADSHWLARLLEGFDEAPDVGLVFGPYLPRPDASPMVARELDEWFASFAPDNRRRLDRGVPGDAEREPRFEFFTDANGCILRRAWEEVRFRDVSYAEDQLLARDMLVAGYAKVFEPAAGVLHSHDYPPLQLFRRCFDEWRGLREIRGQAAEAHLGRLAFAVQRRVRDDVDYLRGQGAHGPALVPAAGRSLAHHVARTAGAVLGSNARHLPAPVRRAFSLEGREGWAPIEHRLGDVRRTA